jgi:anti-sigma factor RsiW
MSQAGEGQVVTRMRSSSEAHVELLLGAYLLGGLSEDEAATVRAHLKVCAMCKDEHDDLALVPGLLSLLSDGPTD